MSSPSSSDRVVGEPGEDGPRSDLPTPPSHPLLRVDVLHVEAHVRPCCSAAARTVPLQTRELRVERSALTPRSHGGAQTTAAADVRAPRPGREALCRPHHARSALRYAIPAVLRVITPPKSCGKPIARHDCMRTNLPQIGAPRPVTLHRSLRFSACCFKKNIIETGFFPFWQPHKPPPGQWHCTARNR